MWRGDSINPGAAREKSWMLKDIRRVQETAKQVAEGLESIDKCSLPGKLKLWCLQYGLMPRIMLPFTVYEVAISHVEWMERQLNKYVT